MEKYGNITENSHCDFQSEKKATYIDRKSNKVACTSCKDKLKEPEKINVSQ